MIKLLFVLLLIANTAGGQGVGASYFALNGFTQKECNQALSVFDGVEHPKTAVLWKSFDKVKDFSCLEYFLAKFSDKQVTLEIHASNESGRSSNRLAKYEFLPRIGTARLNRLLEKDDALILEAFKQNAQELKDFIDTHRRDGLRFIVTTGLEDRFTNEAYKRVYQVYRDVLNYGIEIFRNPVGGSIGSRIILGANGIELHGLQPDFSGLPEGRQCIASNDGNDIDFSDRSRDKNKLQISRLPNYIRQNAKRGCLVFVWTAGPQGRLSGVFVEPRRRRFQFSSKALYLVNFIVRKYGN